VHCTLRTSDFGQICEYANVSSRQSAVCSLQSAVNSRTSHFTLRTYYKYANMRMTNMRMSPVGSLQSAVNSRTSHFGLDPVSSIQHPASSIPHRQLAIRNYLPYLCTFIKIPLNGKPTGLEHHGGKTMRVCRPKTVRNLSFRFALFSLLDDSFKTIRHEDICSNFKKTRGLWF